MDTQNMSFDEINAHVEKHFDGSEQKTASAGGAASDANLCQKYAGVRPILSAVSGFPLIPQKWRDAIKAFMAALDVMCPLGEPQVAGGKTAESK